MLDTECDPVILDSVTAPDYPNDGEVGHEIVTQLPSVGKDSVEYIVMGSLDDCSSYRGSYVWDRTNKCWIETSGGGGGGSIVAPIKVTNPVGRYGQGATIPAGTPLEEIVRGMLEKVSYPTLTNPSATLSYTGPTLKEIGEVLINQTASLTFSRGSINPAYGTNGFRAGEATQYEFLLNGVSTITPTTSYKLPDISDDTTIQARVTHKAGEQPKDSDGKNYNTPLPAGVVASNTYKIEFVYAVWANDKVNTVIDKLPLIGKSAQYVTLDFVNALAAYPETIDIPATWTVSGVEVYDPVSKAWKATSDFTTTSVTHDDAAGRSVAYVRYYDKRGFNQGARQVRLKIKQP